MREVKKLVSAGSSVPGAIKETLSARGLSVSAFALKHGLVREEISTVINLRRIPEEADLIALATELGGTPEEWLKFWWEAARPNLSAAASR